MKELKKITSVLLFVVTGFLISCSSDDGPSSGGLGIEYTLVGTWELISVTSNGTELLSNPDCLDRIIFTSNTFQYLELFDFNDGNGCVSVRDQLIPPQSYQRNGNSISTTVDGEEYFVEIIELSSTTLKLQDIYVEDGVTYIDVETYTRLN